MAKALAYTEDREGKHAVLVLSRPNAIGLVDIEFDRTGERRSVPARTLSVANEAATALLRSAESFVSVKSVPAAPESFDFRLSSLHDRLGAIGIGRNNSRPGILLRRETAAVLIGEAFATCSIDVHELRMFYSKSTDKYLVRAYLDSGNKRISDFVIQHQTSLLESPLMMPKKKPVAPQAMPEPGKDATHPVLGCQMREVIPLQGLITKCGSLHQARKLLLGAKQIEQRPVHLAVISLVCRLPDGDDLIVYGAMRYLRNGGRQWCIGVDAEDIASEVEDKQVDRWETEWTAESPGVWPI